MKNYTSSMGELLRKHVERSNNRDGTTAEFFRVAGIDPESQHAVDIMQASIDSARFALAIGREQGAQA